MALTGWELAGVDLRTLGTNIVSASGWDGFPSIKTYNTDLTYKHGYFRPSGSRWVYRDRDIVLSFIVLPLDRVAGGVTSTPLEHVEENIEYLASILYSPTGEPLILKKTTPSGVVKTIGVIPEDVDDFQEDTGLSRSINLVLNAPYPFWHIGAIDTNAGLTGSFTLDNDGGAPINDMVITFNAAVTLTHTASGAEIVTTAGGLVLDVGQGSDGLSGGDHADISANKPWLMEMYPGTNNFTVSGGTVDIDYYHASLT